MVGSDSLRPGKIEVGIVVRDLDAAAAFYRDVLGLEYIGELEVPVGIIKRFAKGDAVVKLFRLHETPALANPPGGSRGGTGLRYLTVQVDDVERRVERCVAAGCAVAVPTFEFEPGRLVAVVEDPEGNSIELVHTAS
jgi:catechol 2,3-dioxygenase-like lactoylglutathione lyase family enzyme